MADRMTPPFRADHVGSLLRPETLLQARHDFAESTIDADELRAIEDDAVRDVVRMQEDLGLKLATDGEFRRSTWAMDFMYRIHGISQTNETVKVAFQSQSGAREFETPGFRVDSAIALDEVIFGEDFDSLRDAVTTAVPKITIPSPNFVHWRGGGRAGVDPDVYPDMDVYWDDLIAAYVGELEGLAARGCTYLQIDDTTFTLLLKPENRKKIAPQGDDADRLHLTYLHQINRLLAAKPDGMTVTMHMCRGNFRSSWASEGAYDYIAADVFSALRVDGLFLEFDDERSGGFEPLRFVPKGGPMVVLGLITSKRGELESKDAVKRRIEEASKYVDIEQICLSPQCGFASDHRGNALTYDEQLAKLSLVVETAAEVWGS
jgi:5-methyltetrahydropteroyltriglutamate--homocysteine methyltransferase